MEFADCGGSYGSASKGNSALKNQAQISKGSPLGPPSLSFSMLLPSLLRGLHKNPFGCNRKRTRGDYLSIQIVIEKIA